MLTHQKSPRLLHYLTAWSVHALTASGAFIAILTLISLYQHDYIKALWLMALTVVIDSIDGSLARLVHVKTIVPSFDGALLDNIVDFLNYVITPVFFLLVKPNMLPPDYALWIVLAITITSSYQFCQDDAKTPDHFFKGFPCYWNYAVLYMFVLNTSMYTNAWLLSIFCILIFVPIKYVYPSRLDYLTESSLLKIIMHACSVIYGISIIMILWHYPEQQTAWLAISLGYVVMYMWISLYRTYYPMIIAKIAAHKK